MEKKITTNSIVAAIEAAVRVQEDAELLCWIQEALKWGHWITQKEMMSLADAVSKVGGQRPPTAKGMKAFKASLRRLVKRPTTVEVALAKAAKAAK